MMGVVFKDNSRDIITQCKKTSQLSFSKVLTTVQDIKFLTEVQ